MSTSMYRTCPFKPVPTEELIKLPIGAPEPQPSNACVQSCMLLVQTQPNGRGAACALLLAGVGLMNIDAGIRDLIGRVQAVAAPAVPPKTEIPS